LRVMDRRAHPKRSAPAKVYWCRSGGRAPTRNVVRAGEGADRDRRWAASGTIGSSCKHLLLRYISRNGRAFFPPDGGVLARPFSPPLRELLGGIQAPDGAVRTVLPPPPVACSSDRFEHAPRRSGFVPARFPVPVMPRPYLRRLRCCRFPTALPPVPDEQAVVVWTADGRRAGNGGIRRRLPRTFAFQGTWNSGFLESAIPSCQWTGRARPVDL